MLHLHAEEPMIHWSNQPLTWNDYKALPDRNHGGALTASSIYYNYGCSNEQAAWYVGAVFLPEKSYVNYEVAHAYMLAHEQLHFDITELFARKLRKAIAEAALTCDDLSEINYLAERAVEEWMEMQDAYDKETLHSINRDAQVRWQEHISSLLEEYHEWAEQ